MPCFNWSSLGRIALTCMLLSCSGEDVAYRPCAECGKGAICFAFYDYSDRTLGHLVSHSCKALPDSCATPEDVCAAAPRMRQDNSKLPACVRDAWGQNASNLREPCVISPDGVVILAWYY